MIIRDASMTQNERIKRQRRKQMYIRRRRILVAVIALIIVAVLLLMISLLRLFSEPASAIPESSVSSSAGTGESQTATEPPVTTTTTDPLPSRPEPNPNLDSKISAQGAIIYDNTSGKLIYSKNGDSKLYPASMTKLLTAVTAMEFGTDGLEFTVEDDALSLVAADASTAGLQAGMRLTFPMLLDLMMLPSGNDAAYIVAARIGRLSLENDAAPIEEAVAEFGRMMTECARSLGAMNSNFVTPDGYHHPDHYTTPEDMLLIVRKAMSISPIRESVAKPRSRIKMLSGEDKTWNNSNQLINPSSTYYYEGAIGIKTGFTNEAGECLAAAAQRNGREIITIVMLSSEKMRYPDSITLLNYGFENP